MPYTPSLPIAPFYNSNDETIPKASQIRVVNPVVNNPKEYYTKILIVDKQTSDPQIIRKLRDIQPNNQEYPKFHFLINQYNKILEGTPIERACNYSPENQNAIVIKLNTAIEGRTERRLNYLVKDLKRKYGDLSVKYANQKSIYSKNCIFYSALTGEVVGRIGFGTDAYVYVVNEDVITIESFKKELEFINSASFVTYIFIKKISLIGKDQTPETYIEDFLKKNTIELGMTNEELNVRAFLTTIREIENIKNGTILDYNSQYTNTHFTDKKFDDCPECYNDHPREVLGGAGNASYPVASSAAGAYQFIGKFWPKGKGFSPLIQDAAAIEKLIFRKAYDDVKSGNIIAVIRNPGMDNEWESLSTVAEDKIISIFKNNIIRELKGESLIYTPVGKLLD